MIGWIAAIGATIADSDLLGSTSALISNSDVTALGNADSVNVNQYTVDKNQAKPEDGKTVDNSDYGETTKNETKASKNGIVVTADALHELKNISVTVGFAGGSAAGGAVNVIVNNGNIIEQGTHKSLISKKGFYYELYNSQFETLTKQKK